VNRGLLLLLLTGAALLGAGCSSSASPGRTTTPGSAPAGSTTAGGHHHHHHRSHGRAHGVPAADLPRPALTPGVALPVAAARICRPGYASAVRNVPAARADAAYARYGVRHVPYAHEVDHLVSLELGGSNAIDNLWPEPYAGRWGARTKDVLENRLHELVCSGQLRLGLAQRLEARNWVAAYRRFVGTPPASPPPLSGSPSNSGYYVSSYPSAHTIYCADDPEWRTLSTTYRHHFGTLAAARRAFPGYRLHQPC